MADHVLGDWEFGIYKDAVRHWMEFFGLAKEWAVYFELQPLENDAAAQVDIDYVGKRLRFSVTQLYPEECEAPDIRLLQRWAFHEVCEVLLDSAEHVVLEMWEKSDDNYKPDWNVLNGNRHTVIRRLENSVFEALQG